MLRLGLEMPERDCYKTLALILYIGSSNSSFCVLQSIENMSKYCSEQEIPFPQIVLTEEDRENPKECYIFMDKGNPEVPIVLHFPLVNDSFREHKRPG